RDRTVTGVQTCALPISYLFRQHCGLPYEPVGNDESFQLLPAPPMLGFLSLVAGAVFIQAGVAAGASGSKNLAVILTSIGAAIVEIGRAACRERVGVWGR